MKNRIKREYVNEYLDYISSSPESYSEYDLDGYIITPDGFVLVHQYQGFNRDSILELTFVHQGILYIKDIPGIYKKEKIVRLTRKFVKEVLIGVLS